MYYGFSFLCTGCSRTNNWSGISIFMYMLHDTSLCKLFLKIVTYLSHTYLFFKDLCTFLRLVSCLEEIQWWRLRLKWLGSIYSHLFVFSRLSMDCSVFRNTGNMWRILLVFVESEHIWQVSTSFWQLFHGFHSIWPVKPKSFERRNFVTEKVKLGNFACHCSLLTQNP